VDKSTIHTSSPAEDNYTALVRLFPNALTETVDEAGNVIRAIDKNILEQEINNRVVDTQDERYQFTWPDKRKTMALVNSQISAILRPVRNDEQAGAGEDSSDALIDYTRTGSIDFDTTENIYIEGDNLDVLKLLRETYLNRVKMIYIDPPYNSGNDLIYNDRFTEGSRIVRDIENEGRLHTNWLNMIYPRLRLARDLLADDGAIFISIDDREQENLKKVCNEIFGYSNCVGVGQWRRVEGKPGRSKEMGRTSEFVLIYAKRKEMFNIGMLPPSEAGLKEFSYSDEKGRFRRGQIYYPNRGIHKYSVVSPFGSTITGDFTIREEVFRQYEQDGLIYWAEHGCHTPYLKVYLSGFKGVTPTNTFGKEFGSSQSAVKEFKALFDMDTMIFDNPKPTKLLYNLLLIGNVKSGDIVLDFFSGSSTTAHAVMQLNAADSGKRKFIMVQIPEVCAANNEAAKAGYATICEIGKERIRRAGIKIKKEAGLTAQDLDTGFRVYVLEYND